MALFSRSFSKPSLSLKMKSIDLFCASQASTAICSSTDHKAIIRHGIRAIDRHIHRLGETPTTRRRTNAPPCSSHLPFDPASYHKARRSSSGKPPAEASRRKSCADADRPTSSRYLLSDEPFIDFVPDSSKLPLIKDYNRHNYSNNRMNLDAFPAFRSLSTRSYNGYESPLYNPSSSLIVKDKLSDHKKTSPPPPSNHQVIELRVSIHCKGCEGKLRKHISRMEGVTSFSIDLATKKVTVIGDVTPLSVLTSISKVKNAQFWPSPTTSSSSSTSSSFSSPSPRLSLSRS